MNHESHIRNETERNELDYLFKVKLITVLK